MSDFNGRVSQTLARVAERDHRIAEYECDQDGHWFHLASGWMDGDTGAHSFRANTTLDLLAKRGLIVIDRAAFNPTDET